MQWIIFATIPLFFFALFWIIYAKKKVSLSASFFFLCFIISTSILIFVAALNSNNPIITFIATVILLTIVFILLFGGYILIALLLLNTRSIFKHEKKRLANSLTLIVAVLLIVLVVLDIAFKKANSPIWLRSIYSGAEFVVMYYFLHCALFLTTTLLCNFAHPRKNQQYIIVLGSGLINGTVPPLLASRINKAIKFYNKQSQKGTPPKLVFSGGQGADEPMPEAEAMAAYAIEKGIPTSHILTETKSTNTLENMQFSKKIITQDAGTTKFNCIYATSNYHLMRAGIYARKAGLYINGIGAKTAFYYLPNAILREYIAFWWMHKKRNIIISIALFVIGILFSITVHWLNTNI